MPVIAFTLLLVACSLHYRLGSNTTRNKAKKSFILQHRNSIGVAVLLLQFCGAVILIYQFGWGVGLGIYLLILSVAYSLLVVLVPLLKTSNNARKY